MLPLYNSKISVSRSVWKTQVRQNLALGIRVSAISKDHKNLYEGNLFNSVLGKSPMQKMIQNVYVNNDTQINIRQSVRLSLGI